MTVGDSALARHDILALRELWKKLPEWNYGPLELGHWHLGLSRHRGAPPVSLTLVPPLEEAAGIGVPFVTAMEGLRRAGPNPTGPKLRDALEDIKNLDLGGMRLSYSPTDHSGLDFADLSIIDAGGKFRR